MALSEVIFPGGGLDLFERLVGMAKHQFFRLTANTNRAGADFLFDNGHHVLNPVFVVDVNVYRGGVLGQNADAR